MTNFYCYDHYPVRWGSSILLPTPIPIVSITSMTTSGSKTTSKSSPLQVFLPLPRLTCYHYSIQSLMPWLISPYWHRNCTKDKSNDRKKFRKLHYHNIYSLVINNWLVPQYQGNICYLITKDFLCPYLTGKTICFHKQPTEDKKQNTEDSVYLYTIIFIVKKRWPHLSYCTYSRSRLMINLS